MLSILVTFYNQEKYVNRSLDSIFNQNLTTDYEVLIGDDGSTDDTCKIINEYISKYPNIIKLFVMDRDNSKIYSSVERASYNRLNLLKNAKGDYVCFLDGDDAYCDFNFIQKSIDKLENNLDFIGVSHSFCEKFNNGDIINHNKIIDKDIIMAKDYCLQYYTHVGTIVFRNIFNNNDYAKLMKLKSFDDNDITFYFLNYGNLIYDNCIVYSYYQNDNSIWNSAEDLEKNLINAIDFEIIKKILLKYHNQLIYKYFCCVLYVFKHKNELTKSSYTKYKQQCINNGIIIKLYNWKNLRIVRKLFIMCNIFRMWTIYKIFNFTCRYKQKKRNNYD